jgi:hypothetical protein
MPRPTNSIIVKAIYGSDQKGTFINVFYLKPDVDPTSPAFDVAGEVGAVFGASLSALYQSVMPIEDAFYGLEINYEYGPGANYTIGFSAGAGPGTHAGDSCPDFTAVVIQKKTDFGGKSGRGRIYVGCIPEELTNTDTLTPAGVSEYEGFKSMLLDTFMAAGATWSQYHYSPKDDNWYLISGAIVVPVLGTQRRRRVRHLV